MMRFDQSENIDSAVLGELGARFDISVRTFNVCQSYGLLEIPRLLAFYIEHGDFYKLKGAGRKTNEELEKICHWLLQQEQLTAIKNEVSETLSKEQQQIESIAPASLSSLKIKLLDTHIQTAFKGLTVRSQNAMRDFLNGRVCYATLHRFFFRERVALDKLRNVGTKSAKEITRFLEKLRDLSVEMLDHQDEDLRTVLLVKGLNITLKLSHDFMDEFHGQIKSGTFPLFAFLEKLILSGRLFDATRMTILRHRMGWFVASEELGLEEIGGQVGLTRERVRQIVRALQKSLPETFAFLRIYKEQLLAFSGNYGLDFGKDLVNIRQVTVDEVNRKEGTKFTQKFFAQIFSILYGDTYILFGEQFDFFQKHYLIKHDLTKVFDFEALVRDLQEQTQRRIKDDLEIDMEGYLYPFLITGDIDNLARARRVCEDLIHLEFREEIRFDFDRLVLCRNTRVQTWEHAYYALEKIGCPAKISIIYQTIVQDHPDFDSTPEALRAILIKEKSLFISFSRTSTYGLVKWETEREGIRGGTIRDIAEEYLQKFSEPKHYFDIADYVLQYRSATSPKSVHGNLKLDESSRFQEFPCGFWGLVEKKYGNFQARQLPKFTRSLVDSFVDNCADPSLTNLIAYLSRASGVQPAQIRAWVDEKVRAGILHIENEKLVVLK